MWGFLSTSDEWRNEFGELREYWRKICVCQTIELAKNLLRISATCSWPKACYLSNFLTTVIFSFLRHQAERYHDVLGL